MSGLRTAAADGRRALRQGGFTYLSVLLLVAVLGVLLASSGEVWHTAQRREKEQELLFVGNQFRLALKSYYEHAPPMSPRYPLRLEDLLEDPRVPSTQRHLRKIYRDPITGSAKWGLIKGPAGEILGVHSLSRKEPVKKGNFSSADKAFENKQRYADWVFMFAPGQYPAGRS